METEKLRKIPKWHSAQPVFALHQGTLTLVSLSFGVEHHRRTHRQQYSLLDHLSVRFPFVTPPQLLL